MVVPSTPPLVPRLQSFSRAASAAVILIGGLVLVGWLVDATILKSILPDYVTMKANTAVAFILAGLSLWLLKKDPLDPPSRRFAHMTGFAVFLIGLLTLAEYLFGQNLGTDQLLFEDPMGAVRTSSPGRMAPMTALNFAMVGSALMMLSRGVGLWRAQCLTLSAALTSLLALIGYAYGVEALYGAGHYTAMALHTSTTFVVLAAGILCVRPDRGVMATFASDHAGGVLMRRLLPSVIGVLLAVGWIRLEGQRAGFYGTEMGLSLVVIATIVMLSVLIWRSAWALNQEAAERARAVGNPAVILLDIKMPKIDGLEVLRTVKADEKLKMIPVVVLTSSREDRDLMESYKLGVNAYVVKPVNFQEFVATAKQVGFFWAILNEQPPGSVKKI